MNPIPHRAPFSPDQRDWLTSVFAPRLLDCELQSAAPPSAPTETANGEPDTDLDAAPWHDQTLPLSERMALAEEAPFEHRLMAAMGQQDCNQCGYDCKGYAKAIAEGEETDLSLCVPGKTPTRKQLKVLVADMESLGATVSTPPQKAKAAPSRPGHARANPYATLISRVESLHKDGASKDTRAVVVDLKGSGITYQPGDSLGVYPENDPALVEAVLVALGAAGDAQVMLTDGRALTASEALRKHCDIAQPSDEVLELLARTAADPDEAVVLKALAREGVEEGHDVLDLLNDFPSARPTTQAFVVALRHLQPRLYSIASSLAMHPDEAHLAVGVVRYERAERARGGVASTFLAERCDGQKVGIYVQSTKHFCLPEDDTIPVIMVGPGTGVAPFRAFLQKRRACGATGKNWLFFGNPHAACDFLYEDELLTYHEEGLLTYLDTAFSRDQEQKIYVQDRMREQAGDLWAWLESGAWFYICGDAERMALDVDKALHDIVREQGGLDEDAARAYVKRLTREGRYLRDVY